jgi:hypothetical protein
MTIQNVSNTPPIPFPSRPRQVMFNGLKVGQVLMSAVKSPDGKIIVAAGTQVTSDLLNRLKSSEAAVGLKEPILTEES